jgi:alanine dehydrogenase
MIAIRREDKNIWEKRAPLIPEHVADLVKNHGIETIVQPSKKRIFTNDEYAAAGAHLQEDMRDAQFILGIKEIPHKLILPRKTYLFFSHTIKGQPYNMPLLQLLLDQECNLMDYECIKDKVGKRLVFFGRFAGLAGMIDTMYILGRRLKILGFDTPLENLKPAFMYPDLQSAKDDVRQKGQELLHHGLPKELTPFICGFTGYGNVSQGAQEIYDLLPVRSISAEELPHFDDHSQNVFYKVVFNENHLVEPIDPAKKFVKADYYQHPEKYRSRFDTYLPMLSIIINGIYWDGRFPRLVTKDFLKFHDGHWGCRRLLIISDISCDIHGSIECTERVTQSDHPAFVYHPVSGQIVDGYEAEGIVLLAVDNLPAELPRDASLEFSKSLHRYLPEVVKADWTDSFQSLQLAPELKQALIVYHGQLTPTYQYLAKYLPQIQDKKE